ncbi:MAG: tRNA threonylcarbamoyladenosine dehydratase [Clostridia bacterium]|nr:tRNA threonylcarbamoyladenosine dehydratase [Clostridia bacterium]
MMHEFSRTELLIGREGLRRLAAAHVAVFGVGGVGGHAAEALARSGVGAIDLIDSDRVSLTNLNRQLAALHSTLGQSKVDVLARRLTDINPVLRVVPRALFYLPETADQLNLADYDYVLDCIDTVAAKLELIARCSAAGIPIISAMGAGNRLDPTQLRVGDIYETQHCPLARVMRRELRRRGIGALRVVYSTEPARMPLPDPDDPDAEQPQAARRAVPGSMAFVPPVMGMIMASVAVRELAGCPMEKGDP